MIVTELMARDAWALLTSQCPFETGTDFETADAGAVTALYREASKRAHPDAEGGSSEQFVQVDRAKHVLLRWLELPRSSTSAPAHGGGECPKCAGKGYVMSHRAFTSMRVQCPMCRGTGELGVEQEKAGDGR